MQRLKNLTIKGKGILVTAMFFAAIALVVLLAFATARNLSGSLAFMADESLPSLIRISDVENKLSIAHLEFKRAVAWANSNVPGSAAQCGHGKRGADGKAGVLGDDRGERHAIDDILAQRPTDRG